jgi:hypothetical protein
LLRMREGLPEKPLCVSRERKGVDSLCRARLKFL